MRILFTVQPGMGHLNPLVPLARRLHDYGNEVRLASASSLLPEIEAVGLHGVAAGRDWLESEAATTLPGFLDHGMINQLRMFAELGLEFLDDLLAQDWLPDVVVRESVEFAGAVYAADLGIPCVEHGITFRTPLRLLEHWAGEPLSALADRATRGGGLNLFEDGTHLNHVPPRWVPSEIAPLDDEHFFAPEPLPSQVGVEPEWLRERDATRPLVYATLGTVFNDARTAFERLIAAAEGGPFDLLLAVGRNADLSIFEAPVNVHLERYVAQDRILPRAAAVVCHGGMGTVMGALRNGLPICCIPLSADQPINALRCSQLGCGISYATFTPENSPLPHARPEDLKVATLRDHITKLLDDDAYRTAALGLAEEIKALPGVVEEADLILRLAAR
jgi:UDP:flavonoid glycosyltransferase YjiC (YdhE family)